MKIRMVHNRAGMAAASNVHGGLSPSGEISQPRLLEVGCRSEHNMVYINLHHKHKLTLKVQTPFRRGFTDGRDIL